MEGKIEFKVSIFKNTSRWQLKQNILTAEKSDPALRAEMRRVMHAANNRLQRLKASGVLSPAALNTHKLEIDRYTRFSMTGDWQTQKTEYGRAVAFLRQPTSMVSGARQYEAHLKSAFNLDDREFNIMKDKLAGKIQSVADDRWVENYLMRYKDFTGELEAAADDVSAQIESDAQSIADALEQDIQNEAEKAANEVEKMQRDIAKGILNAISKAFR